MIKRLFLSLLLLLPALALADTVTVTWRLPTQNTDGSAIPATGQTALKTTVIEYGTCSAPGVFGESQGQIPVAVPATAYQLNLVVVQEYCLRAFSENNAGMRSDPSNIISFETLPATPNPPEDLAVTGDTTAYTLIQSTDRVALLPVGVVNPGTVCDKTQEILGKYVVPIASVSWAGTVRPRVVVASCFAS